MLGVYIRRYTELRPVLGLGMGFSTNDDRVGPYSRPNAPSSEESSPTRAVHRAGPDEALHRRVGLADISAAFASYADRTRSKRGARSNWRTRSTLTREEATLLPGYSDPAMGRTDPNSYTVHRPVIIVNKG